MDDDWDDTTVEVTVPNGNLDKGRSFSAGRGFISKGISIAPGPGGDTWDDTDHNGGYNKYNNNESRGFRGRGGRGGGSRGGGRGGRGGFRNRDSENGDGDSWDNNDNGNDSNDDDFGGGGGRGRGRGGRGGRGRGGDRGGRGGDRGGYGGDRSEYGGDRGGYGGDRGGRGGNRGDEDGQEEKKREIYVPPDPTDNEDEIYKSGNTTGINFTKYDNIEVKVTGEHVPPPINSFQDAGLRPLIVENIKKSGYPKPTPIQKHSIPIIMNGRDLMACAQTGSGKTAAFLLPILHNLLANEQDLVIEGSHVEPQALIISPTRELTIQIWEQARKFALHSILKVCLLYGGTSVNYQKGNIMKGCHVLVATPGRLNDFVKRGHLTFNSTRFVVLDEADRMLDMGFLPCVEEMMSHETMTPTGERNTLMYSATFPEAIQLLAGKFLQNYIFVAVGIVGGACSDVEQKFYQVDKFKKRQKLVEVLQEEGTERTLIFVETKRNADFLASYLSENDFPTTSIHGDRLQRERETALNEFKQGVRHILVATGVAARGLDIKNVKHVINFDIPKSIEEYVHRIGRTGRVGNRGKATSFYDSSQDGNLAVDLAKILTQADQAVPDWLSQHRGGFYETTAFGGEDVRGENFGDAQDFSKNPVEQKEEEW